MGRDTQIRDAVRNESGVEPTHHARGSRETTESVTADSADEHQILRKLRIRRAKNGLKRLEGRTRSKIVSQKVVKSRANAVVASLAKVAHPSESGQGDGGAWAAGEKENLIPPMLLASLTSTATRSKKMHGPWRVQSLKWKSSVSVDLEGSVTTNPCGRTWPG